MKERREPPQEADVLKRRVAESVDVSGAFDNCFFHAYAAYLLTNDRPLPEDLFLKHPENGNSPGERLKQIFQSGEDLDIFSVYHQIKYPAAPANEMLVEKTMVLGLLFREWFVRKLLDHTDYKAQLFNNDSNEHVSFLKMIQACRDLGLQLALSDDRHKPIYEANKDFFDRLNPAVEAGEEGLFQKYWDQEGYTNYCKHLGKPGVKVSFTDVVPVLIKQKIPYVLYSKPGGAVTSKHEEETRDDPLFELAISGAEGHYSLLKQAATATRLEEYQASMLQYTTDREEVLLLTKDQSALREACDNRPSQLLKVILPSGCITNAPINELVSCVQKIKSAIPPIPPRAPEVVPVEPKADLSPPRVPELGHIKPEVNLSDFNKKLAFIKRKAGSFQSGSDERVAAETFIMALDRAKDELKRGAITADKFKKDCVSACMTAEQSALKNHRGFKQLIANVLFIVISIVFLGIPLIKRNSNWFDFFKMNTDSINQVKKIKQELEQIEPKNENSEHQEDKDGPNLG